MFSCYNFSPYARNNFRYSISNSASQRTLVCCILLSALEMCDDAVIVLHNFSTLGDNRLSHSSSELSGNSNCFYIFLPSGCFLLSLQLKVFGITVVFQVHLILRFTLHTMQTNQFFFQLAGFAGRFSLVPMLTQLGAGVGRIFLLIDSSQFPGLLGIASVVCDLILQ